MFYIAGILKIENTFGGDVEITFERKGENHNKSTDFRSYFISFDDGARLEIMTKPEMSDPAKDADRTGYAHVAFSVGSAEKVDELTALLKVDGYEVLSGPCTTGDGYYESCVVAVEGNQIEITV